MNFIQLSISLAEWFLFGLNGLGRKPSCRSLVILGGSSLRGTQPAMERSKRESRSVCLLILFVLGVLGRVAVTCAGATAKVTEANPGTVFAAGDLAYQRRTYEDFVKCYGRPGDAVKLAPARFPVIINTALPPRAIRAMGPAIRPMATAATTWVPPDKAKSASRLLVRETHHVLSAPDDALLGQLLSAGAACGFGFDQLLKSRELGHGQLGFVSLLLQCIQRSCSTFFLIVREWRALGRRIERI